MNKIQKIIEGYCEGHHHLEFSKYQFPSMIAEIKNELIAEIEEYATRVDVAVKLIKDF